MAWAKKEAKKDTDEYNAQYGSVSFSLSQAAYIPKDEERSFNIGYLFYSSYVQNYGSITSAEKSVRITSSLMISMRS